MTKHDQSSEQDHITYPKLSIRMVKEDIGILIASAIQLR